MRFYLDLSSDLVLLSDALNIKPGFGKLQFFFDNLKSL